jgi:hypothetical protein
MLTRTVRTNLRGSHKEMGRTFTKALLRITATSQVNPVPLPVDVGADCGEAPRARQVDLRLARRREHLIQAIDS